jgi:hypothetical protein
VKQLKAAVPEMNLTVREIEFDFPQNMTWQQHCHYKGADMWATRKQCGCTCGGNCWKDDYLHMNRFFVAKMWKIFKTDPYLSSFDYCKCCTTAIRYDALSTVHAL